MCVCVSLDDQEAWEGYHQALCVGVDEGRSGLLEFYNHAQQTNETFLLAAQILASAVLQVQRAPGLTLREALFPYVCIHKAPWEDILVESAVREDALDLLMEGQEEKDGVAGEAGGDLRTGSEDEEAVPKEETNVRKEEEAEEEEEEEGDSLRRSEREDVDPEELRARLQEALQVSFLLLEVGL